MILKPIALNFRQKSMYSNLTVIKRLQNALSNCNQSTSALIPLIVEYEMNKIIQNLTTIWIAFKIDSKRCLLNKTTTRIYSPINRE